MGECLASAAESHLLSANCLQLRMTTG